MLFVIDNSQPSSPIQRCITYVAESISINKLNREHATFQYHVAVVFAVCQYCIEVCWNICKGNGKIVLLIKIAIHQLYTRRSKIYRSNQDGCKSLRACFKMRLIIFRNLCLFVRWFLRPNISEYVFHLHQSSAVVLPGSAENTSPCSVPSTPHRAPERNHLLLSVKWVSPRLQNIDSCRMLEASSFLILGFRNVMKGFATGRIALQYSSSINPGFETQNLYFSEFHNEAKIMCCLYW